MKTDRLCLFCYKGCDFGASVLLKTCSVVLTPFLFSNCIRKAALQSPSDCAWSRLYDHGEDNDFMTTMGVTRAVFTIILSSGFEEFLFPLRQSKAGVPRVATAASVLGLTLHHLSSTMRQTTLCQLFGFVQSTISKYLNRGIDALLK